MPLTEYLKIKKSTLPGAGKGLFTTIPIAAGTRIVEYLGKIKLKANSENTDLRYAFVVKPGYVIDAMNYKKGIAQYANDATGTGQIKNLKNNAQYERDGLRVYIKATKSIKANTEILVFYGIEYWIEENEESYNNPSITSKNKTMATAKKAAKKAAPKKAAPKKAVAKKAAPKKAAPKKAAKKAAPKKVVAKKVAPKKAAAKKAAPKKGVAKKAKPTKKGASGGRGG